MFGNRSSGFPNGGFPNTWGQLVLFLALVLGLTSISVILVWITVVLWLKLFS
jgi:hypothetical protein